MQNIIFVYTLHQVNKSVSEFKYCINTHITELT